MRFWNSRFLSFFLSFIKIKNMHVKLPQHHGIRLWLVISTITAKMVQSFENPHHTWSLPTACFMVMLCIAVFFFSSYSLPFHFDPPKVPFDHNFFLSFVSEVGFIEGVPLKKLICPNLIPHPPLWGPPSPPIFGGLLCAAVQTKALSCNTKI